MATIIEFDAKEKPAKLETRRKGQQVGCPLHE